MQELLPPLIWATELLVVGVTVAGMWRTFEKATARGWLALIPLWNLATLIRISGRPAWPWLLLLLIPGINLLAIAPISIAIARRFSHGIAFGLGLAYLPFVFYPVLGFGSSLSGDAR